MRFVELVEASRSVGETAARLEKIGHLAEVLKRLSPDELEIGIAFLSGSLRQGRIGLGRAVVAGGRVVVPAGSPTLDLADVDAAFDRIAGISGPGSSAAKAEILRDLFGRATEGEQDFLVRLLFGELRQGALEGVMLEAVARAAGVPGARDRKSTRLNSSHGYI